MKFGLTQAQFDFIHDTVVVPITKEGGVVWCFGSRARGDYRAFSDLDLLICSEQNVDRVLSIIEEILVNSNFPYKIDIIQEKYLANSYKDQVLSEKVKFSDY